MEWPALVLHQSPNKKTLLLSYLNSFSLYSHTCICPACLMKQASFSPFTLVEYAPYFYTKVGNATGKKMPSARLSKHQETEVGISLLYQGFGQDSFPLTTTQPHLCSLDILTFIGGHFGTWQVRRPKVSKLHSGTIGAFEAKLCTPDGSNWNPCFQQWLVGGSGINHAANKGFSNILSLFWTKTFSFPKSFYSKSFLIQ